jgi:signal transduction histidine kinase
MGQIDIKVFIIGFSVIFLIFLAGIIIFIYQYRKRKILYDKEVSMMTEKHTREMLAAKLEAQQITMQDIGLEIHDNVGQKLTLASLYSQQLEFQHQDPSMKEKIGMISNIINESLTQLRILSKSLTHTREEKNDLVALLQQECERINATGICKVVLQNSIPALYLKYHEGNIVHRILQEFMQNSLKHGECTLITIGIDQDEAGTIIKAADNGHGFDVQSIQALEKGIGLGNISKRAASLGATATLKSKPGRGTELVLNIPNFKKGVTV